MLLVLVASSIGGIPANYLHQKHRMDGTAVFLDLVIKIQWATVAGVVAHSMIRRGRRPADYGFSLKTGGVASLAVLAAIHVYLAVSGKLVLPATGDYVWGALGAFMEELLFRAIAIDILAGLMDGIRGKTFWAIAGSAALWSLPHISSKSIGQLVPGIFLGGLFFGYIYHRSRSLLLPAWVHAAANAGYGGGMLVAGIYCLIGGADRAFWARTKGSARGRRAVPGTTW